MIPIGAFRPDVGGPGSGFAASSDGGLPKAIVANGQQNIGYAPIPDAVSPGTAAALPTAPRGSISTQLSDGTWNTFFGTDTTIEQLQADYTFSPVATGLNPTSGDDISFAKFGAYLLNTNTTDGFKAYNMEAPAGNNTVADAPSARQAFVTNNVVFALDCDGNNRRMESSGLGNHTVWNALGADGKTFEDGGALICGRDLKNGVAVIFQDAALRLIQFGPAPDGALYTISKISDGVGSAGERSVVAWDGTAYFLSVGGGFYAYDPGNGLRPISYGKVEDWFLKRVDLAAIAGVQGAADARHKMIWWRWKKLSTVSDTVYDTLLGFCWGNGEWTTATVQTAALTRLATPGYTLEQMDVFGVLDDIDIPLDDPFWQGTLPVFACLNADLKYAAFSGGPMATTLETSVINNPVTGLVGWATPINDDADGLLQLGVNDRLDADPTWKAGAAKVRNGSVPLRGRGMNIAFRSTHAAGADWSFDNGVDNVKASQGGPK